MTNAGIAMQQLKETERHNKAGVDESIGRQLGSQLGSAAIGAAGKVAAAYLKKNDIEFYNLFEELYNTSTKIPFPMKAGQTFLTKMPTSAYAPRPMYCVHNWVPTIGTRPYVRNNEALLKSFKQLFDVIRGRNSGSTNYDPVDLGIVCLSIDSVLTYIHEAIRALRLVNKTKELQPATRRHLADVLGYNYTEMITQKQDWLNIINKAIYDINSLLLPGGLSYFRKHEFLSSVMIAEKDVNLENYYRTPYHIYRVSGVFTYDETNGELDWNPRPNGTTGLSTFRSTVEAMISPLISSQAIAVMTGDIQRAVNEGSISPEVLQQMNLVTLDDIDNETPIIHDEQMLMQIRNERLVGEAYNLNEQTEFGIHQDVYGGNPFVYQGTLDPNNQNLPVGIRTVDGIVGMSTGFTDWEALSKNPASLQLKSTHDVPSQEEIMESTRMMVLKDIDYMTLANAISATSAKLLSHGSEIVKSVTIWYYSSNQSVSSDSITNNTMYEINECTALSTVRQYMSLIRGFKYAPTIIVHRKEGTTSFAQSNYQCYNMANVDDDLLVPIHECALRSQFYFVLKGKSNKKDYAKSNSKRSRSNRKGKNFKKDNKSGKDEKPNK